MDNVTHTLIGVTFARALPARFQRPAFYWAAVIGSNLPDSDFLYSLMPGSIPLDYLVHHRGYTHTLLAAIPLGLFTAWIARKTGKEKTWDPWLIGIATLACVMHIAADFLNNYGVHPFTPFWNHWIYGDSIFIVEPLIWFSLIPYAAQCAKRTWSRRAWWSLFVLMLALIWFSPQALRITAILGSLYGLFIYGLQHWKPSKWIPITSFFLVILTFSLTGRWVKNEVRKNWHDAVQGRERMTDIDAVPSPANPVCWRTWVNSQDEAHYISRAVVTSVLPRFIPPAHCPAARDVNQTAQVTLPLLPSTESILWINQYDVTIDDFEKLKKESCSFRRLLTFTRHPYVKVIDQNQFIAGDLRYDREEELGFSEILVHLPETCTKGEPWSSPFYR